MPVGALHLLFQGQLPVFLFFLKASNLMWRRVCGIITDRVGDLFRPFNLLELFEVNPKHGCNQKTEGGVS